MKTFSDQRLYEIECAKMDAMCGDPIFVVTTDTLPELRADTPRQGGSLFARFFRNDEESFLKAAKYVGLSKHETNIAREQAVAAGVMA